MKPDCIFSLACAALALALTACGHESPHSEGHESSYVVTRVAARDVTLDREYVGQIHARRHIEVRALERGYLQNVSVQEGQVVEAGQPMFEIQPVIYQAELDKARAEASAARVEFENTRTLAENDVVSASQLAMAGAEVSRAQAEVDLAEAHLGFAQIKAPFAGIMDRLHVWDGSLIEEGELLTTLSDNSTMWVYFNVPETDYLEFMAAPAGVIGRPVELRMANGRTFETAGAIAAVEANFNNTTGTVAFRADFPNPDRLLRHGQTGNVVLSTSFPDSVVIPQKATFEILDHVYALVVDDENVVHQRRIEILAELEDLFVVRDGLSAGESIVFEGVHHARPGSEIEYEFREVELAYAELKTLAE